MSNMQYLAVLVLAITGAVRIVLFDTRGRRHKPLSSAIAWLMFVWLAMTAVSVFFCYDILAVWLLILGLALHIGAIIKAGGNIAKIHPFDEAWPPEQSEHKSKARKIYRPQGHYSGNQKGRKHHAPTR